MKNPCKECIIKVNCSSECFAFKNYTILLNQAIKNFERARYVLSAEQRLQLAHYIGLRKEAENFSSEIFMREMEKKIDNIF